MRGRTDVRTLQFIRTRWEKIVGQKSDLPLEDLEGELEQLEAAIKLQSCGILDDYEFDEELGGLFGCVIPEYKSPPLRVKRQFIFKKQIEENAPNVMAQDGFGGTN